MGLLIRSIYHWLKILIVNFYMEIEMVQLVSREVRRLRWMIVSEFEPIRFGENLGMEVFGSNV